MSSSSAFTALPIIGYAIAALCVSYICLRVWRYSRARLSARVSLPQPVSSAKESFSLVKATSWDWSRWSISWPRTWSKTKSKPAAILATESRDNSVELLPTTGLPPPPTPPLVDLGTPTASASSGAHTSTRTPSPTQHHKHVAHQLYSRPASPHAFLATTSPQKNHKRSRSLGGVPVRRLSSGTNSALRNAFPTPSTPPPDFDHEMREIASSSNHHRRDQILIDFSTSGSSEEGDAEHRVSPAASDIGVLPSHAFTKPRPSPVPLVDFAQPDFGSGVRGRQPVMDDMDGWRWFKSPALASFGQHTQKVANFASTTATAIGVHAWASRSTSSLVDIPRSSMSDKDSLNVPLPASTSGSAAPVAESSIRLVDVDTVEAPQTAISMPEPIPFKLPPPPMQAPVRLIDVELPVERPGSRAPASSKHVKNASDMFHHPLEELVDVLAVPIAASKPLSPSGASTAFASSSLSVPNSPSPPFAAPSQLPIIPMSIAHSLSLPLDLAANQPLPLVVSAPVPTPTKVSIVIPTPTPVVCEIIDTPTTPLIPVFQESSTDLALEPPVEETWSWDMEEMNQDPWADHIEIPVPETEQEDESERESEHEVLIDLEQEDAERELALEMGFSPGYEQFTDSTASETSSMVVGDSSKELSPIATTPQNLPFTNITNIKTFNDNYASPSPISSETDESTSSNVTYVEPSLVAGSMINNAQDAEKENQMGQVAQSPSNEKEEAKQVEEVEEVDAREEENTPRATPAQRMLDLPPPSPLLSPVTALGEVGGLMELELSYRFADPPSPVIFYDEDSIESFSLDSYFPDPDLLPLPSPTKISRFEISMPTPPPSAQFGSWSTQVEDLEEESQYASVKPEDESLTSNASSIPHIQTPTPPASPPPSSKGFGLALDTAMVKESLLAPPASIAPIARGNKGKAGRSLPPSPRLSASKSLSPIQNNADATIDVRRLVVPPMAISRARSEGANVLGGKKGQDSAHVWAPVGVYENEDGDDGQITPVAMSRPLWSIRAADAPVLGLGSVQNSPVLVRRALEKEKEVEVNDVEVVEEVKEIEKEVVVVQVEEIVEELAQEKVVADAKVEEVVPVAVAMERTSSVPGAFPEFSESSTTLASSVSSSTETTLAASESTTSVSSELKSSTSTAVKPRFAGPSVRTIVRSPIEIALAMQLRPGLGLGADPAWMVRFLMSMYGWFAVMVSGQY